MSNFERSSRESKRVTSQGSTMDKLSHSFIHSSSKKSRLCLARRKSMYKGLQQLSTFVFTDSSDVTEVYVTEGEIKAIQEKKLRKKKSSRPRFKMATICSATTNQRCESPPRLTSSATSIIKRPSSTLMRHSSLSNHEQVTGSVSLSVNRVRFSDSGRSTFYEEETNRRTQLKILRDLCEAKQAREKRTEIEFLQFAKEFAKKCRSRPTDNLLNPVQYESYLRDSPHSNSLHGVTFTNRYDFSLCSNVPYLHSSSASGLNSDETSAVSGHVVGDLLSFTTNTARFFDSPDLCDVILLVGGHRFYAHKFALAAQSDVLRDMLLARDRCTTCPDFQKELELNESKECQDVFPSFLRFFYCGKITFTSETALPLLVLSAKYRVEALRVACDAFITGMIEDGDLKSAVRWLKYASVYQLHDLTSKCVDGAVADNVEELVESSDWLDLSADCIESILKSSSLLVPHEFFLFEALLRWFINKRQTCEEKELIDFLRKILPQIRFSQMHGTQLLAVEESPIGLHFKHVIRSYLSDAYRYQILSKESPEFQEPLYLPRDYTDKEWCVQFFYNPNRTKRIFPSTYYGNGRWEIQPRRYYDTLNVVIILKKPLENDIKVFISILIYKRNGSIHMRLRRKACILRAVDTTPRPTLMSGASSSTNSTPGNSPRSTSSSSNDPSGKTKASNAHNNLHPHRSPHGPASKLHGPNNGQEYYAIDNIISDGDFQVAMSNAVASGLKLGVIIRTWGVNVP